MNNRNQNLKVTGITKITEVIKNMDKVIYKKKSSSKILKAMLVFLLSILPFTSSFAEIKTEQAMTPQMLFIEAVQQGQIESVKKFISENMINPNQVFEGGVTPLHVAVMYNHEAIVALLIQAGAKLNEKDSNTLATPLHMAALYGRTSVAKLLIQKGANIEEKMKFGITPLMVAAQFNQPQIVEVLLNAKAKVNQADEEGFTALHCAAQTGDEMTAKLLLKHGARLDARDRMHATPLTVAKQNNKIEIQPLLTDANTKE